MIPPPTTIVLKRAPTRSCCTARRAASARARGRRRRGRSRSRGPAGRSARTCRRRLDVDAARQPLREQLVHRLVPVRQVRHRRRDLRVREEADLALHERVQFTFSPHASHMSPGGGTAAARPRRAGPARRRRPPPPRAPRELPRRVDGLVGGDLDVDLLRTRASPATSQCGTGCSTQSRSWPRAAGSARPRSLRPTPRSGRCGEAAPARSRRARRRRSRRRPAAARPSDRRRSWPASSRACAASVSASSPCRNAK